jgi:homoserine dehydrogenase
MRAHEGGYYVAMELWDRPGEVAAIAKAFAEEGISIESIVQKGPAISRTVPLREEEKARETAPFILITHDTLESAMRAALARIEAEGHCVGRPRMIRIERFR